MPRRKNIRELGVLSTQSVSDHHYMGPISVDGTEGELKSLSSGSACLCADSTGRNDPFVAENKVEFKDYSVSHEWHRPYVEALFESDEAGRGALIAEAERAIVDRFLELLIASVETDEVIDLQNAAHVITELKKASAVAYTPQHLVA
jgi:hypothetical protein